MTEARSARGVCVIGRSSFNTGIGRVGVAALELLSQVTTVSLYPTDDFSSRLSDWIDLPSGRPVQVAHDLDGYPVYLFTDVLWNGAHDLNYTMVPAEGLRIAHIAFDSDELASEWVEILNTRFDVVLVMSPHLEAIVRESGVEIAIGSLPLALDIDAELARPARRPLPGRFRFGTISAFHERKNLETLIEAFAAAFTPKDGVELVIHSNLTSGSTFQGVSRLAELLPEGFVSVTSENLTDDDKNDLINSMDVYINIAAGEGYSIGPREALAQGKPLVLSDIPAHRDLSGVAGVFLVGSAGQAPARYPEIDNRVFGKQAIIEVDDVAAALAKARAYLRSDDGPDQIRERRHRAAEFSMTTLKADYQHLVDPEALATRSVLGGSTFADLPPSVGQLSRSVAGRFGSRIGRRKIIVPAHDGGFFSLFNIFMSNLVWSLQDASVPLVLPDWDVTRLLHRCGGGPLVSYCYSTPEDGNMWLSLFEPLHDLSAEEMNDPEFLYQGAELPLDTCNEHKEPLLTFTSAFDLYRASWFQKFRRQYNSVLRDYVVLRPHYQEQVDAFQAAVEDCFLISVHVKHPSHSVEQPDGRIAGLDEYLGAVRRELERRHIAADSEEWRVFVATDQERVVQGFRDEFGDRIVTFPEVRRVSVETDDKFNTLGPDEKVRDGHQLQHQLASDPSNWSTRWAWEVWRDAEAMAAGNVLLHAVSNVATAASYLNDAVEMIFCAPE